MLDLPITSYGTTAFTCVLDTYVSGAARSSNHTRVPASVVLARPEEEMLRVLGAAGPRAEPKIVMNSPGATAPGRRLPALVTRSTLGATATIISATLTATGLLLAPSAVIVMDPV